MTIIRDATRADAARLLEIYSWYVVHTAITFDTAVPSLESFSERMARTQSRYPFLVLEADGAIQGYACAGPFVGRAAYDWSCETTIYLDHAAQKRGYGRRLYAALETALRAMGILNLYACIGTPQQDDAYLTHNSAAFHAHMGYTQVGFFRRCGYKFGRWYDMIWMEKCLGPHLPAQSPVRAWEEVCGAVSLNR